MKKMREKKKISFFFLHTKSEKSKVHSKHIRGVVLDKRTSLLPLERRALLHCEHCFCRVNEREKKKKKKKKKKKGG